MKKCGTCGREKEAVECTNCDEGYSGHDCGDDSCCCADPEPNVTCDICNGRGMYEACPKCAPKEFE